MAGWIGELHPRRQQQYDMAQAAVWFEVELGALTWVAVPRMSEIAKFLPMRRDLAVLVDEAIAVQTLLDAMQQAAEDKALPSGRLSFSAALSAVKRVLSTMLRVGSSVAQLWQACVEAIARAVIRVRPNRSYPRDKQTQRKKARGLERRKPGPKPKKRHYPVPDDLKVLEGRLLP